jgi:predicted nucleic acid-binding protein
VKFWDSSAVVPLLVRQAATAAVTRWRIDDPAQVVWWSTPVECESAIARLVHAGQLDRSSAASSLQRLDALAAEWIEVEPSQALRDAARRLLQAHALRAGDALQLAAALRYAAENGEALPFVSLDERLATAARAERFPVVAQARSSR